MLLWVTTNWIKEREGQTKIVQVNVSLSTPRVYHYAIMMTRYKITSYACASRVEQALADGDYELVPTGEEGQASGDVNVIQVEDEPNPAAENPQANHVPEGKPRSISHVSNLATMFCTLCLCIYVQELNWNLSCMILGTYALQY